MRKPYFYLCQNKGADQLAVTAQLISVFVFATLIVQFPHTQKFQDSSFLLWMNRPVCVGSGQKCRQIRGAFAFEVDIELTN